MRRTIKKTVVKKAVKKTVKKAPIKKAAPRTKFIPEEFLSIQKIITIQWDKVKNGYGFIGTIKKPTVSSSIPMKGIIYQEGGEVFLFQNTSEGSLPENVSPIDYGYKYSYCIGDGTNDEINYNGVEIHSIYSVPEDRLIPESIMIEENPVFFRKGYISVGCTDIPNVIVEKIYKNLKK